MNGETARRMERAFSPAGRAEADRLMVERRTERAAELRRRRARVIEFSGEDGEGVTVEYTNDAGERVAAHFGRTGWAVAPSDLLTQLGIPEPPSEP